MSSLEKVLTDGGCLESAARDEIERILSNNGIEYESIILDESGNERWEIYLSFEDGIDEELMGWAMLESASRVKYENKDPEYEFNVESPTTVTRWDNLDEISINAT
jgi:hypothetical protein